MKQRRRATRLALLLALSLPSCSSEVPATRTRATRSPDSIPLRIDTAYTLTDSSSNWTRPSRDYASTRFSPLTDITPANAKQLISAGTFSLGVLRGQEAAPIVVGNTMYVVTSFPNIVYALDLTRPGLPARWSYQPKPEPAAQGVACCDVVNRGAVYDGGRIFFNTLDNHTIALDAETGKVLWNSKLGDINRGETITMAPLVVKGKVLVGNSGGEFGVRGWLTALDAADGQIAWRAYSTGPDSEVLIGPGFTPHYSQDRGSNLGVTTWPPDAWRIGGGTVWGWISYDPALDLIYYGTGNPGPWNPDMRPGSNKWTAGIFARDPDDGSARWFYQTSPHDLHDYDGVNELILLDLQIGGITRKVIVRPERNGYVYILDRTTGEVLSADPFVTVTTSTGVDLATGDLLYDPAKAPQLGKVVRNICPASPGAKDWQPSSYSPKTGLVYIPHQNLCMDAESIEANYIAGTPYVGMNVKMYAGPGGHRGLLTAWDPVARRARWQLTEDLPVWSGKRWMGGSKRSMRETELHSGSSTPDPESSDNR
jgi:lanthanide-dependent methanol dehydrogenase